MDKPQAAPFAQLGVEAAAGNWHKRMGHNGRVEAAEVPGVAAWDGPFRLRFN